MSIGDALRDMPDEYKEYVEEKEPEQSEVDKAIADGKPRWMYLSEPGWQYVVLLERRHYGGDNTIGVLFREAIDRASETTESPVMVALESGMKVLPYGESPPPAKPEESEADKAIRDKKPRWIKIGDSGDLTVANGGWKYGAIESRQNYGGTDFLWFQRGDESIPSSILFPHVIESCVSEILPYGETPPQAEAEELESVDLAHNTQEKPKAVASIVFKHDGGEWLHMADNIGVENHPYEGVDHRGWRTYRASPSYSFTLSGKYLGYPPAMEGDGTLTVTMLQGGEVYKGKAHVHKRDDFLGMNDPRTDRIVFMMKRDAEPAYEPDPLERVHDPLQIHEAHGPLCPDCDAHTEPRSMPDGIEQWCPVCNVKVEQAIEQHGRNAILEAAAHVCDHAVEPGSLSDAIRDLAKELRLVGELNSQRRERSITPPDMIRPCLEVAARFGTTIRSSLKLGGAFTGKVRQLTDASAKIGDHYAMFEEIRLIENITAKK